MVERRLVNIVVVVKMNVQVGDDDQMMCDQDGK